MFMRGGICYVYLCYGMHYLFNVVTNIKEIPHAVLIRSIKPLDGINKMYKRRKIITNNTLMLLMKFLFARKISNL